MRKVLLILIFFLSACAQSVIAILPPESGQSIGGLEILDIATETPIVSLSEANTQIKLGKTRRDITKISFYNQKKFYDDANSMPPAPVKFLLYFKQGSNDLVDSKIIDLIILEIGRRAGADVEITGHTDTAGDPILNDLVSAKRASNIEQLLVNRGIAPTIIRTAGRGERELRVLTDDDVDNAENRRVEVTIY